MLVMFAARCTARSHSAGVSRGAHDQTPLPRLPNVFAESICVVLAGFGLAIFSLGIQYSAVVPRRR